MTYRQLLKQLRKLSKPQLDLRVVVRNPYASCGAAFEINVVWIANAEAKRHLRDVKVGDVLLGE